MINMIVPEQTLEAWQVSLRPSRVGEVPEGTARIARAVFPNGCLAMRIRDVLGAVFTDDEFAAVFPSRGRPAISPALLAFVSVLQFGEGLTDRQAAHAVRARIDWKYALGLELDDTGFDHSVLCEFRARLVAGGMEQRVLDAVLEALVAAGLVKEGGRQRSDSTHVLAAVRDLNRLEFLTETLRAALNMVAAVAPEWLAGIIGPEWFDRYSARPEDRQYPTRWAARVKHADQVGEDGMALLRGVSCGQSPSWLRELPAVEMLRRVWVQQYEVIDGHVRLRKPDNIPAGQHRYRSPYDPDSRVGGKHDLVWAGYKVHLTETCEPDAPHVITDVTTTNGAVADITATTVIHSGLAARQLLPTEHLVDAGYVDAEQIIRAREDHRLELVGPVPRDTTRQHRTEGAFDNTRFQIDWDAKSVTCPGGKTSAYWRCGMSHRGTPVTKIGFAARDCTPCLVRKHCTTSRYGRQLTLRPPAEHDVLRNARQEQETPQWQERYKQRSGIEGTISQGVLAFGLRRSRYRGLAKTRLQHVLTAAAMNFARVDAWLTDTPLAPTRISHFAALRPAA